MPNYQDAKIYMIWSGDDRYYGSTTQTLANRMAKHRTSYKRGTYTTSHLLFNKYGVENCEIELVETYPCNNVEELTAREGHYIRNNKCVNKCIPCRTPQEYYQDHKEKIAKYYQDNRYVKLKYQNEYNKLKRVQNTKINTTDQADGKAEETKNNCA